MKKCGKCKVVKPVDEFYRDKSRKDGHKHNCIPCLKETNRQQYIIHKKKRQVSGWAARHNRRAVLEKIKIEKGCYVCGEKHPAALDFHHLDPSTKKFQLGNVRNQRRYTEQELLEEAKKCVVICANHHRILHYEEWKPAKKND